MRRVEDAPGYAEPPAKPITHHLLQEVLDEKSQLLGLRRSLRGSSACTLRLGGREGGNEERQRQCVQSARGTTRRERTMAYTRAVSSTLVRAPCVSHTVTHTL